MAKITEENIVFLTITSWAYSGIGTHYYGRLRPCNGEGVFDVSYKISQVEAARFNKNTRVKYEVGEESERFFSRSKLITAAKKQFKKYFSKATILVLGDRAVVEPQEILVGPKEFKDKITALAKQYDKLDWDDIADRSAIEKIEEEWQKLWPRKYS